MSIQLAADVEARIREKVASGAFPDPDQGVREAMGLLDEQERELAALRAKLKPALAQLARGEGIPFTVELVAQLRREAAERFQRGELPNPDVCP